jgi:hypothetical protein
MVVWLYELGNINVTIQNYAPFRYACEYGHVKIAKWLYQQHSIPIAIPPATLHHAFAQGYFDLAIWLWEIGNHPHTVSYDSEFCDCCIGGHLNLARWLYSKTTINIHDNDNIAFRSACAHDHIQVAQWLFTLAQQNETVDKLFASWEDAFSVTSKRGSLAIVQWLHSLKPSEELMKHCLDACSHGQVSIVQWIGSLTTLTFLEEEIDQLFQDVCQRGYLEVAQLLYGLGFIDIRTRKEEAIQNALRNLHLSIVFWLESLES